MIISDWWSWSVIWLGSGKYDAELMPLNRRATRWFLSVRRASIQTFRISFQYIPDHKSRPEHILEQVWTPKKVVISAPSLGLRRLHIEVISSRHLFPDNMTIRNDFGKWRICRDAVHVSDLNVARVSGRCRRRLLCSISCTNWFK